MRFDDQLNRIESRIAKRSDRPTGREIANEIDALDEVAAEKLARELKGAVSNMTPSTTTDESSSNAQRCSKLTSGPRAAKGCYRPTARSTHERAFRRRSGATQTPVRLGRGLSRQPQTSAQRQGEGRGCYAPARPLDRITLRCVRQEVKVLVARAAEGDEVF